MGKYKLVALDMDGTVLNELKQISEANRKAIYAALNAGVTVIFFPPGGAYRTYSLTRTS